MRIFQKIFGKIGIFYGIAAVIWVFFSTLKSKSGYFLGFSKKFQMSIPITSTLRSDRYAPPGPTLHISFLQI